jgi:hypothetical protein
MKNSTSSGREKQARVIRGFRKIHRVTASLLFIFFFLMASTGLLLGLKKHSGGVLLSKSYSGISTNLKNWLPIDSLNTNACKFFKDSISSTLPLNVDRIEIHKEKGMVKFVFAKGFWAIQLDATTGELLHIERRRADFIERVHDGSILDYYFKTSNGQIKLVYTIIMGVSLLLFTITGFWLWYGPKRMQRKRSEQTS